MKSWLDRWVVMISSPLACERAALLPLLHSSCTGRVHLNNGVSIGRSFEIFWVPCTMPVKIFFLGGRAVLLQPCLHCSPVDS